MPHLNWLTQHMATLSRQLYSQGYTMDRISRLQTAAPRFRRRFDALMAKLDLCGQRLQTQPDDFQAMDEVQRETRRFLVFTGGCREQLLKLSEPRLADTA